MFSNGYGILVNKITRVSGTGLQIPIPFSDNRILHVFIITQNDTHPIAVANHNQGSI